MLRIAIIAPGTRGDFQPYLALGKGLQDSGHTVRIISHADFSGLAALYGVDFWPVEGNVREAVESSQMRELVDRGNFREIMRQMAKQAENTLLSFVEEGLAACRGMDLIVAGAGGLFIGAALAEKLGLPLLQAYVFPLTPTREFASVLAPALPVRLGGLNWLSHQITRQLLWQNFRKGDTQARRQLLGIGPTSFWGPYHSPATCGLPVLYGYSPALIPVPRDWSDDMRVTGYWFLDAEESWTPPAGLVEFLKAGPPPVYIGFGSMSSREPEQTARMIVEALRSINQRAVLLAGWGGLDGIETPDGVYVVDSIPHTWLFPRVAAVVHHGGAGTTAAGLRAGVPSVIIPSFGDQGFWGARVHAEGAGPAPIPRKKLTGDGLAAAIHQAVTDEKMRQRAADLGVRIRSENGIARAAEIMSEIERRGPTRGKVIP